jgi:hypothetical protein
LRVAAAQLTTAISTLLVEADAHKAREDRIGIPRESA